MRVMWAADLNPAPLVAAFLSWENSGTSSVGNHKNQTLSRQM
jgi:hypothetical protein